MAARPVPRSARPVSWTRAVLCLALATLVHLFGCAHGPAPALAPADSFAAVLLAAPPAGPQADAPAVPCPDDGTSGHGAEADGPSTASPRAVSAPAPERAVALPASAPVAGPPRGHPLRDGARTRPRPDRSLSVLGVWRT